MFRKKRYTFLFVIIALCFLAFSFFRLLPVTFSRGIPVAEEIETPDTYGGENLKDYPGGEDPGEINTPEQMPEASSGQPRPAPAAPAEESGPSLKGDRALIEQLSFLQSPIPGAQVSSRDSQLPGAPRTYRNGTHQGLDYYDGACGVPIQNGNPVYAAGEGVICRIDHNYTELTEQERNRILQICGEQEDTPADILDKLRGRQVWIRHSDSVKTIYAHLSSVAEDFQEGDHVKAGDFIGNIGNSGTSDGMKGTTANSHLHFEVWIGEHYLGDGLSAKEARKLLKELLE
jgi:murein DD-endopeptidase MepM/ murein hydrolase activator NlpD